MITSDISSKYTHYLYDRPENIRTNIHDKINHIHPSSHTRYDSNVIQRPKVCIPIVHLDVQSSLDRRTVSQRLKIIHRLHHRAIACFGVGEAGKKRRHRRNIERYAFVNRCKVVGPRATCQRNLRACNQDLSCHRNYQQHQNVPKSSNASIPKSNTNSAS